MTDQALTPEDIERDLAIHGAATLGEWSYDDGCEDEYDEQGYSMPCPVHQPIVSASGVCVVEVVSTPDGNGKAIAHLHNVFPRYAAEIERLTKERDASQHQVVDEVLRLINLSARCEVAESLVWDVATGRKTANDLRRHIEQASPDAPTWEHGTDI